MATTETKPPTPTGAGDTITIPDGCQPSRVCGSDQTRPALCHAWLTHRDDGWWLCATDSYIAIALRVRPDGKLVEGWVSIDALRLMERDGTAGQQLSPTAWRVALDEGSATFDVALLTDTAPPDMAKLGMWDRPGPGGSIGEIGMNPTLMARLGHGLDMHGALGSGLRFTFAGELKPIRVAHPQYPDERIGLQMPIQLHD